MALKQMLEQGSGKDFYDGAKVLKKVYSYLKSSYSIANKKDVLAKMKGEWRLTKEKMEALFEGKVLDRLQAYHFNPKKFE